jgi:hypothetical protein
MYGFRMKIGAPIHLDSTFYNDIAKLILFILKSAAIFLGDVN